MKKTVIGLFLIMLGFSCKKYYTISVGNQCQNDTIYVEYVDLESSDTSQIQLPPMESKKLYDSNVSNENYNWSQDYKVHINYIINSAGDSINIDPNLSSNWSYGSGGSGYGYILKIQENSFQ